MSNLLRKLTDQEVEKNYSIGGNACSYYRSQLTIHAVTCAISMAAGGLSGCDSMNYAMNYVEKYCK